MRGVTISLYPDGPQFVALVQPVSPEPAEYAISKETRTYSKVFILRSEIGSTKIGIGSIFVRPGGTAQYRVARIDDNDIDVRIGYHCETSEVV